MSVEDLKVEETEDWLFKFLGSDSGIKALEPYESLPKGNIKLFTIANTKDLFVAAGKDGIVSGKLSALRSAAVNKSEAFEDKHVHPVPFTVKMLEFSADEQSLAICPGDGNVLVYSTVDFSPENTQQNFICQIETGKLRDIKSRPEMGMEFAVLEETGKLSIFNTKDQALKEVASGVTAFAWSKRGKQLVAGRGDGRIGQYTPAGELIVEINKPEDLDSGYTANMIYWTENTRLIVAYSQPAEPEEFDFKCYVGARAGPKSADCNWKVIDDPIPAFGDLSRDLCVYAQVLYSYAPQLPVVAFLSSGPSSDVTFLTNEASFALSDDSARATLPFTEDDTGPIGMALDFSATEDVKEPAVGFEVTGALPILWIMNNEGMACGWHVVWKRGLMGDGEADLRKVYGAHKTAVETAANNTASSSSPPNSSGSAQSAVPPASTPNPAFGQSSFGQPAFGQSSFGQSSFGQSKPLAAFGGSGFGSSSTSGGFGSFGSSATGNSGFGAFANQNSGSNGFAALGNNNKSEPKEEEKKDGLSTNFGSFAARGQGDKVESDDEEVDQQLGELEKTRVSGDGANDDSDGEGDDGLSKLENRRASGEDMGLNLGKMGGLGSNSTSGGLANPFAKFQTNESPFAASKWGSTPKKEDDDNKPSLFGGQTPTQNVFNVKPDDKSHSPFIEPKKPEAGKTPDLKQSAGLFGSGANDAAKKKEEEGKEVVTSTPVEESENKMSGVFGDGQPYMSKNFASASNALSMFGTTTKGGLDANAGSKYASQPKQAQVEAEKPKETGSAPVNNAFAALEVEDDDEEEDLEEDEEEELQEEGVDESEGSGVVVSDGYDHVGSEEVDDEESEESYEQAEPAKEEEPVKIKEEEPEEDVTFEPIKQEPQESVTFEPVEETEEQSFRHEYSSMVNVSTQTGISDAGEEEEEEEEEEEPEAELSDNPDEVLEVDTNQDLVDEPYVEQQYEDYQVELAPFVPLSESLPEEVYESIESDFDQYYLETNHQFKILNTNAIQMSNYLYGQMPREEAKPRDLNDVYQLDEWNMGEMSDMIYITDTLLLRVEKMAEQGQTDDAKVEELKRGLGSLALQVSRVHELIKYKSGEVSERGLRLRSLPVNVVELQRKMRQHGAKLDQDLGSIESEINVVKSQLSKYGSSQAPSAQGIRESISKITNSALKRRQQVQSLVRDWRSLNAPPPSAPTSAAAANTSVNMSRMTTVSTMSTPMRTTPGDSIILHPQSQQHAAPQTPGTVYRDRVMDEIDFLSKRSETKFKTLVGDMLRKRSGQDILH